MQDLTQTEGRKNAFCTDWRQDPMNLVEVSSLSEVAWPIATPAGVVEKKFRGVIRNYQDTGVTLLLDIHVTDSKENNGNRIIVDRLNVEQISADSLGVTGEILRKLPVQKLAEECVYAAIAHFYPQTRPKKPTLRVPTVEDISRTELVAQTILELGIKPSAKDIQAALNEQGVSLEEGTIRNYITKAKKAGLLRVSPDSLMEETNFVRIITPADLSEEAALIEKLLFDAATSGIAPISPQVHRRRKAKTEEDAFALAERKAKIRKVKRTADIAKINSPIKKTVSRKEGK